MSAFSNYLEEKIVQHWLQGSSQTSPSLVYLALFTGDPLEDGTGPETTYTGYARQLSSWSNFSAGQTKNSNVITFPPNGQVGSVVLTHGGVFDALANGNLLIKGLLATPKTLAQNDVLSFAINALALGLD